MSTHDRPTVRLYDPSDEAAVIPIIDAGVEAQEAMAKALKLPADTGLVDHGGGKSKSAIRERPRDCFVAERGGQVVGFMHVIVYTASPRRPIKLKDGTQLDRYLSVAEIDVAPDARQTKVGSTLLRYADTIARQRDCEVIGVSFLENNEGSARMNKRCGYMLTKADLFGTNAPADSGPGVTRWKYLR